MSEIDYNAESETLSLQDVAAFFAAAGASPLCPICRTDKWSLIAPDANGLVQLPLAKNRNLTGKAIPAIFLSCNHCGFLRPHSSSVVVDWKRRQEAPDG